MDVLGLGVVVDVVEEGGVGLAVVVVVVGIGGGWVVVVVDVVVVDVVVVLVTGVDGIIVEELWLSGIGSRTQKYIS